jgi:hypothetical protein
MMKRIKELGLEVIELEEQVLLVNKNKKPNLNEWYLDREGFFPKKVKELNGGLIYHHLDDEDNLYFDRTHEIMGLIVASTKPLEGLLLLVIEDAVEKLAINSFGHKPSKEDNDILLSLGKGYVGGFKEGYNKAKSTYKFTEEDLRKAYGQGKHGGSTQIHLEFDEFIQSLTKKELWVEVDDIGRTHYIKEDNNGFNDVTGINFHKYEWIPKITNNQIKGIWK